MNIYDDMRLAFEAELRENSHQGTILYIGEPPSEGPDYDPTPGISTEYPVFGQVAGVSQRYVDGTTVLVSDLQARLAVFDTEPSAKGTLSVDGEVHQIVRVLPIPAAGPAVGWKLIIRS